MSKVAHRASIGSGSTLNTTSLTVVIPASVLADDILILVTANRNATTDPTVVDDDTGGNTWAKLSGENNTGSGDVWWKRATSGTASKTITVSGCTDSCSATVSAFSGCLLSGNPYEAASAEANASADEAHASITTLGTGRVVCLAIINLSNDNATSAQDATDPNVMGELIEHLNTGGSDCATSLAVAAQAQPGATGSFTWAQTNGITVSVAFALIPEPTTPNVTFIEPGTDATGGLERYTSTLGSVSSATDAPVPMTGPRAIKSDTGAGAAAARVQINDVISRSCRGYFEFQFATLPTGTIPAIAAGLNSSNLSTWRITMETSGAISFSIFGATSVIGTTTLVVNTKYRISWAIVFASATSFSLNVWVNGVYQGTANAGTATNTDPVHFVAGLNVGGANRVAWFDNIYVDDGGDMTDPCAGFAAILVTAKKPAANNTNNFDTAVGANPANRWTNVNEVPRSDTNGWSQGILADTQENYGLEAVSAGDVNISGMTILGREAWLWGKGTLGGLGTPKIMDNGTETAIVLTAAGKLFTVLTTTASYPSNAAGIGMRATNNADDTFLYECGTVIAVKVGHIFRPLFQRKPLAVRV